MSALRAFILGPLANPLAIGLTKLIIGLSSNAFSATDLIHPLLMTTALSYGFTILFGLPVFIVLIYRNLVGPVYFILGAATSTILFGLTAKIIPFRLEEWKFLLIVFLLATLNALLMWALIDRPRPKYIQDE